MTKAGLVARMAKDAKISKAAATKALAGAIDEITKSLKKGQSVTLIGFGTFSVAKRKARKGRNPQTGKVITISARRVPKFKAGADLKKAVK